MIYDATQMHFHLNFRGWSVDFEMWGCEDEKYNWDYDEDCLVVILKDMNPDIVLEKPQK